jgi:hypothetical protein
LLKREVPIALLHRTDSPGGACGTSAGYALAYRAIPPLFYSSSGFTTSSGFSEGCALFSLVFAAVMKLKESEDFNQTNQTGLSSRSIRELSGEANV